MHSAAALAQMSIDKELFHQEIIQKYNEIHNQTIGIDSFIFMNDGYMPLDNDGYPQFLSTYPELNKLHSIWRHQSYLYIELLKQSGLDLSANLGSILDVGCGRGGGLSVFRDYYKINKLTGLDLNPNQVEFANHTHPDINFVQGSAMDLPFAAESFDIITNVESANYYFLYDDFLKGINKTLKPNGLFLYADTFDEIRMQEVTDAFKQHGLEIVSKRNITANVRAACAIDKYRMLPHSRILADVMMWDEERYYSSRRPGNNHYVADYYIMVIKKVNS
jgi:ubiquinone/menaquinone biosynthesis C-methylase UbiE